MESGTPVPNSRIESQSRGTSGVTTYFLSPEELEKYRNQTKPKDRKGAKRAVANTLKPITKELYLVERLSGKSRTQIQREYYVSPAPFYAQLGEWGMKEMAVEQEVLAAINESAAVSDPKEETDQKPSKAPMNGGTQAPTTSIGVDRDPAIGMEEPEEAKPDPAAIPPRFITIRIPLIDVGTDAAAQRRKCYEKIEEISTELEPSNINHRRAVSELFDLAQIYAGLIRTQLQDLIDEGIDDHIDRFFNKHNDLHIEKLLQGLKGGLSNCLTE